MFCAEPPQVFPFNAFMEFLHHIYAAVKHEPLAGCKAAITNSTHYSRFKYLTGSYRERKEGG